MSENGNKFLGKIFSGDTILWVVVAAISLFSVTEIYSATSFFVGNSENHMGEMFRHALYLIFGISIAVVLHKKATFQWLKVIAYFSCIFSLVCLFFMTFFKGMPAITVGGVTLFSVVTENEATRWVKILGHTIQPSEVAKLGMIMWLAFILTCDAEKSILIRWVAKIRNKNLEDENFVNGAKFFFSLMIIGIFAIPIFFENLSTAIILSIVGIVMIWLSKINDRYLKYIVVTFAIVVSVAVFTLHNMGEKVQNTPLERYTTWENRFMSFWSSDKYEYNDKSAQIIHSQIAVARGGWFGVVPGNSIERDHLSQIYADFIFAIVLEEWGFIGGLFLAFSFLVLFYRCGIIAKRADSQHVSLLTVGLGMMITLQAFISMAVTVRLGPVTGQPLPLLSRGGTSVLFTCMFIGIIQRMAVVSKQQSEKKKLKQQDAEQQIQEDNEIITA